MSIIWSVDFVATPTRGKVPIDVDFDPSTRLYDRIIEVDRDDSRIYEVIADDKTIVEQV